jgi:hypothetical protein
VSKPWRAWTQVTAGTPEADHGVYWFAGLIAPLATAWAALALIAWAIVEIP